MEDGTKDSSSKIRLMEMDSMKTQLRICFRLNRAQTETEKTLDASSTPDFKTCVVSRSVTETTSKVSSRTEDQMEREKCTTKHH